VEIGSFMGETFPANAEDFFQLRRAGVRHWQGPIVEANLGKNFFVFESKI
jgi:hypothetical protein